MFEDNALNNYRHFYELAALANSGTLTVKESAQLADHMQTCRECRDVYKQYLMLSCEGIPQLAPQYNDLVGGQQARWDENAARRKLIGRICSTKLEDCVEPSHHLKNMLDFNLLRRPQILAAVTVCLIMAVGLVAYFFETRTHTIAYQARPSVESRSTESIETDIVVEEERRNKDAKRIAELQEEISHRIQELAKLGSFVRTLRNRESELVTTNGTLREQFQALSQQREALSDQLQETERTYQAVKKELVDLRVERDNESLQKASLESRIDELSALNREQTRTLKDDEQYLADDRDIRELMGARKLYIADVFDVDSGSNTQKTFGRIFYTQGRSLLFYAFDLDRQAVPKDSSTFQAWGRRLADGSIPLNLGIFFKDSESNHRWVLRFDDAKKLAEIDSVFVTTEPHGGSQKPTGKPFLFALLREEANHP
jgi:hypothetical protein